MTRFALSRFGFAVLLIVITMVLPSSVYAEELQKDYDWVKGTGQKVAIGSIAELTLDPTMVYLDTENTRRFVDENGNISSESDIASVYPVDDDWAVFFQYYEEGHVPDDEKDTIDADELLQSYKEGTEAQNDKIDNPEYHLFVEGWEVPPSYDDPSRTLSWTLRMHDGNNNPVVNQNVRILTRVGNMAVILVTDPAHLQEDATSMNDLVLSKLTVNSGQRYEDFDESTDEKADYGLTGLILGGAGIVAAKKLGLIALIAVFAKKFGIILVAALGGAWQFIRGKSKKKKAEAEAEQAASIPADEENRNQSL